MGTFSQDLRYGVRMVLKSPLLSGAAIVILALGIGANLAIFSFVDAIWLRPLPAPHPEQLIRIYTSLLAPAGADVVTENSYPDMLDIRAQSRMLTDVAAIERRGAIFEQNGEARQLIANVVSDNFLSLLGSVPPAGRTFSAAPASTDPMEVMLSYDFWQRQFGGEPSMVGHEIVLSGRSYVVVGILPRDLSMQPLISANVWIPVSSWLRAHPDERAGYANRDRRVYDVVARLRNGATMQQARTELKTIAARLERAYPDTNSARIFLVRSQAEAAGEHWRGISILLMAIAGLVLLVACANVANLLLARAEHRRQETATRLALGATRMRLMRQLLSESLLLAAASAVAAVAVAYWVLSALPALTASFEFPVTIDAHLDARALLFAGLAGIAAVFASGLAPAVQVSRTNLLGALKSPRGTGARAGRRGWLRSAMVFGQISVSMMLVVVTGLLVRTVFAVQALDPGFNSHQPMLLVQVLPTRAKQPEGFYRSLREAAASLPGVKRVALAARVPLSASGGGASQELFLPKSPVVSGRALKVNFVAVSDGYFEAMGTRLLRGRAFTGDDTASSPRGAVVNRAMADRLWPDGNAIGQRFRMAKADGPEYEVVGMVENGKYNDVAEDDLPYLFLNLAENPTGDVTVVIATDTDPAALAAPVRERLRRAGDCLVLRTITMREFMRGVVFEQRIVAQLVGALGGLGLLLAAAGLYGLISYMVSRRTHEIGVRMALGAPRSAVFRLVLGSGIALAAAAVALGAMLALALSKTLAWLIFGVSTRDPLTFLAAAATLLLLSAAATYVPARRATRIDPIEALRCE
jgi:putative ABC transport system permease protein